MGEQLLGHGLVLGLAFECTVDGVESRGRQERWRQLVIHLGICDKVFAEVRSDNQALRNLDVFRSEKGAVSIQLAGDRRKLVVAPLVR